MSSFLGIFLMWISVAICCNVCKAAELHFTDITGRSCGAEAGLTCDVQVLEDGSRAEISFGDFECHLIGGRGSCSKTFEMAFDVEPRVKAATMHVDFSGAQLVVADANELAGNGARIRIENDQGAATVNLRRPVGARSFNVARKLHLSTRKGKVRLKVVLEVVRAQVRRTRQTTISIDRVGLSLTAP